MQDFQSSFYAFEVRIVGSDEIMLKSSTLSTLKSKDSHQGLLEKTLLSFYLFLHGSFLLCIGWWWIFQGCLYLGVEIRFFWLRNVYFYC